MELPKRDVFNINTLPPEIWASVVEYLSGEQLGRLKMTGDVLLWRKLTSHAVVKSITIGNDFMVFSSLPSFLNELLSLRELSICIYNDEWWSKLDLRLDILPFTLRKLKFKNLLVDSSAFFVGKNGETLNLADHLPHLEVLELMTLGPLEPSCLARCSTLTDLSIPFWDGGVALPPTLVHFKPNRLRLVGPADRFKLPPELETIITHEADNLLFLVQLLPPSLRLFSPGSECETSHCWINQLPKSLTSLRIPAESFSFWDIDDPGPDPRDLTVLPPTITELFIHAAFHRRWSSLPPNLTKLQLQSGAATVVLLSHPDGNKYPVESCSFEDLPRSITHLSISSKLHHFSGPPPPSAISSYFPPNLTFLELPGIHLSPEAVKLLPSSLSHLKIQNLCEQVSQHLPRGLTKLVGVTTLLSPNLLRFLPTSLVFLQLTHGLTRTGSVYHTWHDYYTGKILARFEDVPRYDVYENYASLVDWKGNQSLPATLTHLDLLGFENIGDSFFSNQAMPQLLHLDLSSQNISDLSIPLLPPCLTYFSLSKSANVTGKCFPQLPRSLTYLNLASSSSIFDSDIQHLPRYLKQAHINSAIHLTDLCAIDFPRRLEYLQIYQNSRITPSSLHNFPPTLRSLQSRSSLRLAKWNVSCGKLTQSKF